MTRLIVAVVALALFPLSAWAQPALLLFPAVGRPGEVTLQGRVLKEAPSRGSSVMSRNLRRLSAPNWEGAPVEISYRGVTVKVFSGNDGVFESTIRLPPEAHETPGLERWVAEVPGATEVSFVRIVDEKAPFFVVSDFDDTVAVSNVTSRRGLVRSALFQDATTQPSVPGMDAFYRCLIEGRQPSPGLAFVSGSPHQFAPRISSFLLRNGFPIAGLYLRDFGPRTLSGYKQPVIRKLLESLPHDAIFIGDSGEHDPEVYAEMRREFPDRVLAVYIRDVGRPSEASRFKDMVLFRDGREAASDAVKKGFIAQSCFDREFGGSEEGK